MFMAILAVLVHTLSPALANAMNIKKPHLVCYQIGDNQYSCDAYWD